MQIFELLTSWMASWVMRHRGKYCSLLTLGLGRLLPAEGAPEFLSCSVATPASWQGPPDPLCFVWVLKLL